MCEILISFRPQGSLWQDTLNNLVSKAQVVKPNKGMPLQYIWKKISKKQEEKDCKKLCQMILDIWFYHK